MGSGITPVAVAITAQSTDVREMGVVGDRRVLDGVTYILAYAPVSVAAGHMCELNSTGTQVAECNASTELPHCVNMTGTTVVASSYFWGAVHGLVTVNSGFYGTAADVVSNVPLIMNGDGQAVVQVLIATNSVAGLNALYGPIGKAQASVASDATDQSGATVYLTLYG